MTASRRPNFELPATRQRTNNRFKARRQDSARQRREAAWAAYRNLYPEAAVPHRGWPYHDMFNHAAREITSP